MPSKNNENTVTASNQTRILRTFPENAVKKEMQLPPAIKRDRFIDSLTLMCSNEDPVCTVSPLGAVAPDVYELKVNGSPGWRCVYYTGIKGRIYVLHVTQKTTNGVDRQLINTVEQRLKALIAAIKAGTEE